MLQLINIHKSFTHKQQTTRVLDNISLDIKEGEFVAIVGPSGCGKSTLLKLIAGQHEAEQGSIKLEAEELGFVFQNYSLYPWLTVKENIALGLHQSGFNKNKQERILQRYLHTMQLHDAKKHFPHQLSGGMRQRVAIARTLINDPELILMDEPFGALDTITRTQLQRFLLDLWQKRQKTILFVTHDIEEALLLADRIIVLKEGSVEETIEVPFQRPRKHDIKMTKEFFTLKNNIITALAAE